MEQDGTRSLVFVDGGSQRGRQVVVYDGFEFTKKGGSQTIWRCSKRNAGCKATVSLRQGGQPRRGRHQHNHARRGHAETAVEASW